MRKSIRRSAVAFPLLLALACAQPPGVPAPAPPAIGEAEIVALKQLMQHEDTRSFDAEVFARLAASEAAFIRARTMMAAGRIGNRAAIDLLLRGLSDPVASVRADAAFAVGELGDSSATVANALGTVSRGQSAAASEALHALGKIGGSAARPYVEEALRTRKTGPELREALLAIWHFPRQPLTSVLVRPFATSSDPETRWRAVYALTRAGVDPANVASFMRWVRDADPLVRSFAVRGLRAPSADTANLRTQAASALVAALQDPDAHVRTNAVQVLAGYRDPAHGEAAAALLMDPDLNTRVAAAQALGAIKGPAAIAGLDARVNDVAEKPAIRGSALVSLLAADPIRGLASAQQFAASSDYLLRIYAARALAGARSAGGLALRRTLATDPDPRVVGPAVAATAAVAGDTLQSARTLFIEKLAAADPFVRAAALGGLERLAAPGDEAIVFDAFDRALRDDTEEAANAAIGVLAKLAATNGAVQRTFAIRFPLERIRLADVRRTAIRQLKLEGTCCVLPSRPETYQRVVETVLLPALRGSPLPRVRFNTAGGSFIVELLAADAPITVDNFLTLARKGSFNGSRWHRVVPNFVLQDGDPTGTGSGGPGYAIRDEINRVRYLRGAMGMALSGPDTGGSQWFVTHSPQPHLDGGYTVFGRVVSGMDVADRVVQDDTITSIDVIK